MKSLKLLLNTNVRAGHMFWLACKSAPIHVTNYIYFTTRTLQPNGINKSYSYFLDIDFHLK